MLKELYQYRQLLKSNVRKEIRGKYKGSFLGVLWSFVNPLLMTLVYAIVFPFLLRSSQPHYTTFIVMAVLPWTWFTSSLAQGTNSILVNGGIIKKGYNENIDKLVDIATNGQKWLVNVEAKEREATGIKNLKIGYNKVFGYYIEVSKSFVH